jgi:tRNA (mo5U34)-methyltransferase
MFVDETDLFDALSATPLSGWTDALAAPLREALDPARHGDLPDWRAALEQLPAITPSYINLNADCLHIGEAGDVDAPTRERITELLMRFHPWRKGPFCLFGIHLDTEWRSDWKWARLAGRIAPLAGRRVLDVGCGNGYYGWRMVGAGAALVIGVDPTLRYVAQYAALRHFIGTTPNYVLPFALESLPEGNGAFDTVFSMGVIYHRRDPLEHLRRLHAHLRPGGELVLEGLVLDGDEEQVLVPEGRYAKMKNVWAVASCRVMMHWLEEAGFDDVRLVDVTATTSEEQRATPWMRFHSLADFLDPADPTRTVEGYPAPRRAILIANRP